MADSKEDTPLVTKSKWRKKDYLVLIAIGALNFAESVEMYLPGVITQSVGCKLGLSKIAEGFLGMTIYLFLALFVAVSGTLDKIFGTRKVILFSQYVAAISIITCSVFPDFYTLVLSRGLIGMSTGLNYGLKYLFIARNMSADTWKAGNFYVNLTYAAGSVWAPLFGYLALERLGWRMFITVASLPMFIVPIIVLQFFITEDAETESNVDDKPNDGPSVCSLIFHPKIFRKSILDMTILFIGYGSVLLFPALLRVANENQPGEPAFNSSVNATLGSCSGVVKGEQFLYLCLTGLGNMLGRVAGYRLMAVLGFRTQMVLLASLQCLCYLSVTLWNRIIVVVVCMTLSKILYSMTRMELNQMASTESYFGKDIHMAANLINQSLGMLGATLGAMNASFVAPQYASLVPMVLGLIMGVTAFLTKDYVR